MVAAPWRRLIAAARWNGHAPHTTTGAASVSDSHCQYVNCSAGTMASTIVGIARAALMMRRCRNGASSSASGRSCARISPPSSPGSGSGSGRVAP